jgi:hypothetical protein
VRNAFLTLLEEASARVATLEARGGAALIAGDNSAYDAAMREKALFLSRLYAMCADSLESLEEKDRAYAAARLRVFSASAAQGLSLGSVFYMSALLFSEDHRPGEPDDLAVLLAEMRRRLTDRPAAP